MPDEVNVDEQLFNKMLDFILDLNEETLTEEQLNTIISIIEEIDIDEDSLDEKRRAKRTKQDKRIYARQYRKKNRQKIKMKRKKFQRSAEGKRRKRVKKRMAQSNKSPTGRRKVTYHK